MYYVYEWYIVETNEVIYVGKGTRNRYKVRKHNKFFNEMILRYECESRIVKEFESEKEAFMFEYETVKKYKEKGQCVCNIYEGGYGGTGSWWSEERRNEYAEHNVMKSEKQRERMSKHNPMKDARISQKVNAQKKRAVIIDGIEYDSIKTASKEFGVSTTTIGSWCVNGKTSDGKPCRFKNVRNAETYNTKNTGQRKPLIYKGIVYESTKELAESIGVSQTTASRWCRNGRDSLGNPCEYLDDKREEKSIIVQRNIPIIINGVYYPSKHQASKDLGITEYTITQYLNGKKKSDEYIIEYGNQHPSRGNTDNSTPEGSTTNK